jgi:hypothetical protein
LEVRQLAQPLPRVGRDAQPRQAEPAIDQVERVAAPKPCFLFHTRILLSAREGGQASAEPASAYRKRRAAVPEIVRKGLTKLADRYTGPRFPEVGTVKPVASDHCPVVIDLTL